MTHHADALPPEDEFEVEKETAAEAAAEAAASPSALHPPEGLSEEEQNAWWMKNVYCGDQIVQFSFRSFAAAGFIGALMAISNLYVGLKSGWGLCVTITAAVMAYALFKSLEAFSSSIRNKPLTMLENCTILSAASASGALSSAGLVSAIPALYLVTGHPMSMMQLMLWLWAVASLGCFMAIPLKRQLINVDKLAFPSGTATAETLRSLYSTGSKAMQQAKTLLWCGVVGTVVKFLGEYLLPASYPLLPTKGAQFILKRYSIGFEPSTIFIAAGAIMGIRVGISMLVGMVVFFGILGPIMDYLGILTYATDKPAFRSVVEWVLWPAVALMVTAGLTNFALRWRMIVSALGELTKIFGHKGEDDSPQNVDCPMSWFILGTAVTGAVCIFLGSWFFGISWWMGLLAVVLTFMLSIVAARATGETDTTPIGAMGKITQLTYGVIDPGNMKTNLMTAAITAGAASHSADLLQSLKTGYLVGANARKQAIAQFFGIIIGVLVCVPVYCLIVKSEPFNPAEGQPTAEQTNIGGDQFPAPAVAIWRSVAEVLAKGIKNLPPWSVLGMCIGGALGILIALLEEFVPKKYVKWIPSATGLGLAGVITPQNSLAMFLGALIAWVWMRSHPKSCDDYMISGASGLIAGESLTGVGINLVDAGKFFFFG